MHLQPRDSERLGGVHSFTILYSLSGAAILACLPRGLSWAEGWVSNHVCDRKQAGLKAVNHTAYFLTLSFLSFHVCSSLFTVSFFSPCLSLKSDKQKIFTYFTEGKTVSRGRCKSVSLSPFTSPSLPLSLTHTHTCLTCLKDS